MIIPGRRYTAGNGYRYGFNGQENDNEAKGEGNTLDFGARIYDPRLGKFLSMDRLISHVPFYSPYLFGGNKPIVAIDRDGDIEILIHVYDKIIDPSTGKMTVNLRYTTKLEVSTLEDAKGKYRTPAEVNVYYYNTAKTEQDGNMTRYNWTVTLNSVEDVKNTGLTMSEDLKVSDPANYYGKKAFAFMTKSVGMLQLTEAMVGEDFESSEKLTTTERWIQFASGLASLASLGRSGAVTGNMKNWAMRKLGDLGAEKVIEMVADKIGFKDKKRAVFEWYIGRFIYDAAKGKIKDLTDLIVKAASLGAKGADFLEKELKEKYNIDLSQPVDKKQALSETIRGYLNQAAETPEAKKVVDQYTKSHE